MQAAARLHARPRDEEQRRSKWGGVGGRRRRHSSSRALGARHLRLGLRHDGELPLRPARSPCACRRVVGPAGRWPYPLPHSPPPTTCLLTVPPLQLGAKLASSGGDSGDAGDSPGANEGHQGAKGAKATHRQTRLCTVPGCAQVRSPAVRARERGCGACAGSGGVVSREEWPVPAEFPCRSWTPDLWAPATR